ncbi:Tn3 family transposase, partial [Escherichia coli]|nr:Tn3 family transposase [Escherichia coli]
EWVHVQLHQQKGMISLSPPTICNSAHGKPVDETLFQYLSPLGWEHINLTGDYLWRSSTKVGAGKFRPLRPLPPA